MTVLIDKDILFRRFNTSSFEKLEESFDLLAPSMVEYYLDDISQDLSSCQTYVNRSNIQSTIYVQNYSLHYDYNDDIYIEFTKSQDEYETQSLW